MSDDEWMRMEAQNLSQWRCPVTWMVDRLDFSAQMLIDGFPPLDTEVLGWVTDRNVCIWYKPTIIRRDRCNYWTGLPGSWIDLRAKRWVLTHWRAI